MRDLLCDGKEPQSANDTTFDVVGDGEAVHNLVCQVSWKPTPILDCIGGCCRDCLIELIEVISGDMNLYRMEKESPANSDINYNQNQSMESEKLNL